MDRLIFPPFGVLKKKLICFYNNFIPSGLVQRLWSFYNNFHPFGLEIQRRKFERKNQITNLYNPEGMQ